MLNFRISETSNDDELLVICLNYDSILNYIDELEIAINKLNEKKILVIDQLLITGNGKNRFIECEIESGHIQLSSAKVIKPVSDILKVSTEFFLNNIKIVNDSFLSEYEKNQVFGSYQ